MVVAPRHPAPPRSAHGFDSNAEGTPGVPTPRNDAERGRKLRDRPPTTLKGRGELRAQPPTTRTRGRTPTPGRQAPSPARTPKGARGTARPAPDNPHSRPNPDPRPPGAYARAHPPKGRGELRAQPPTTRTRGRTPTPGRQAPTPARTPKGARGTARPALDNPHWRPNPVSPPPGAYARTHTQRGAGNCAPSPRQPALAAQPRPPAARRLRPHAHPKGRGELRNQPLRTAPADESKPPTPWTHPPDTPRTPAPTHGKNPVASTPMHSTGPGPRRHPESTAPGGFEAAR